MQNVTVSLLQVIVIFIMTLVNATLQTIAYRNIKKSQLTNSDITKAAKLLLGSLISQYVTAFVMIAVAAYMIANRNTALNDNTQKVLVYGFLVLSTSALLTGGVIGASVSTKLQCFRNYNEIEQAWQKSTISATSGILGTVLVLLIQAFIRRDTLKKKALEYMQYERKKVPVKRALYQVLDKPAPWQLERESSKQKQVQIPKREEFNEPSELEREAKRMQSSSPSDLAARLKKLQEGAK